MAPKFALFTKGSKLPLKRVSKICLSYHSLALSPRYVDSFCAVKRKQKKHFFIFIFTALHFTIVQIIFHFLWDHWAHCGIIENGVLMYTLEGVNSVENFITAYEESQ